jgi:hypothetical protein
MQGKKRQGIEIEVEGKIKKQIALILAIHYFIYY